ncbi:hypothetical protein WICMUC_002002 [Wickerhamomyces mucosus]|uniref:Pseudouridine synthase I TruA alpha/beta domain-containing protein n=1 Tax=Wickerhamomyces mucosus TaxID=1378264 RepID=A0A9P8TFE5_9ASCO|nr:hypothetical protein WICMUC_002002 [Wickerhamomyces mucosus]
MSKEPLKNYESWSKEELIRRISELERSSPLPIPNGKSLTNKSKRPFDFSRFNKRFIALRFSYLGWNYNGLAIQKEPTPLPTIEQVLIDAMFKCKLIPSKNPSDFKFSRCGRTDKGVSAMNQVVALEVRSNLTVGEQQLKGNDAKELDYINILNSILPSDIKIHTICLRPPKDFDARFSCTSRYYKYIFSKKGLDIELMRQGASNYLGEHDFRNFCKIDGSKQITNYNRSIYRAEISQINDEMYCFELQGSAFLWHQVRNMISILFLIGQKLESPEIIKELTNIDKYPTRPVFEMGNDLPLILYDCKFENDEIEWIKPENNSKNEKTLSSIYANWLEFSLKQQIGKFMFEFFVNDEFNDDINSRRTRVNLGDGKGRIVNDYQPLNKRERLESFEIVNERWLKKPKKKNK